MKCGGFGRFFETDDLMRTMPSLRRKHWINITFVTLLLHDEIVITLTETNYFCVFPAMIGYNSIVVHTKPYSRS